MSQYLRAAKLLLGCYRTGDANDPEVYISAVVRVLADYPIDVAQRISDPLTGLPSKLKWLPAIPEILAACEEIEGPRRRSREWDERTERQLRERDQQPPKPTREEFIARHGEIPKSKPERVVNKELLQQTSAHARNSIVRQYEAAGREPVKSMGLPVSMELVEKIAEWRSEDAEHQAYRREHPVE